MIMEFLAGVGVGMLPIPILMWRHRRWMKAHPLPVSSQVVWRKSPEAVVRREAAMEKQGGRRPRVRQARFSRSRYLDGGG